MVNYSSEDQPSNSVGIIGCGWLGKVLAQNLLDKNIPVLATSSKQENVEILLYKEMGMSTKIRESPDYFKDLIQFDLPRNKNNITLDFEAIEALLPNQKVDYILNKFRDLGSKLAKGSLSKLYTIFYPFPKGSCFESLLNNDFNDFIQKFKTRIQSISVDLDAKNVKNFLFWIISNNMKGVRNTSSIDDKILYENYKTSLEFVENLDTNALLK